MLGNGVAEDSVSTLECRQYHRKEPHVVESTSYEETLDVVVMWQHATAKLVPPLFVR